MTNPFDVDIFFIGIFGIVPDASDYADITKLALLVPRTDHDDVKCEEPAQDSKPLYRHRWFTEFNASQVKGMPAGIPKNVLGHWILSKPGEFRRVTFNATGATTLSAGNALNFVCDFEKVAPDFAEVPREHLGWPAAEPLIGGQVMFNIGDLIEPPEEERPQWIFPGTLNCEGAHSQAAHHKLHLHLDQVTDFLITARTSREDENPRVLALHGTPNMPGVRVTICNLCDVNPLRWPTPSEPGVDDDYRWYYELSANKDDLEDCLLGLDLPVPHPSGDSNALGQNCLGNKFKSQSFTID